MHPAVMLRHLTASFVDGLICTTCSANVLSNALHIWCIRGRSFLCTASVELYQSTLEHDANAVSYPVFFFFRFFSSSGRVLCTPEQHNAFACKRCFRRQFDKNWASRRVIACDLHTRCSQWLLDIVLISLKTSRFSLVQRFRFQHFAGSCQNRCLPIYFSCTVILTSQATSKCNAQNVTLSRSLIKFCCFFFFSTQRPPSDGWCRLSSAAASMWGICPRSKNNIFLLRGYVQGWNRFPSASVNADGFPACWMFAWNAYVTLT